MKRLMLLALTAVAAITALLALLWVGQRSLMYFPDSRVPAPREVGLAGVESVRFPTADGLTLAGWFVPAGASTKGSVLVFNGNAGNRAYRAPLATALAAHGFNVLLFDYRGFGGNPGSPTETGLTADARAARAYLTNRPDVDAARLVYFGESLGTGVAVGLAAEQPPAALILRSPFTSMAEVGAHHYPILPVRLLLRDQFASRDTIARVRAPVLVIAGDRDNIVPFEHSRRLYDVAPSPKELVIIKDASHNDDELLAGEEMIEAIVRFLSRLPAA